MVNLADLPNAGPLSGSEILPMQQGAGAVKASLTRIVTETLANSGQTVGIGMPRSSAATVDILTDSGTGIMMRSSLLNYSAVSIGMNTTAGYTHIQSHSGGSGAVLPFAVFVGTNRIATFYETGDMYFGTGTPGVITSTGVTIRPEYVFASRAGTSAPEAPAIFSAVGPSDSLVFFYRNGASTGSITSNGSTTSYNTTSDYRLPWKAGHTEVTNSGEFIDALNPRYFPLAGHAGFIAHEVQEVSPSSVTGDKDAVDENGDPIYQQMDASSPDIMANIIAELQSLRRRVAALEAAA